MNRYKGYEYPSLKDFFTEDEKYTDPNNSAQWKFSLEGIGITIPKTMSAPQVDESFKRFIDVVIPDTQKVMKATQEMIDTVSGQNKQVIDEVVKQKFDELSEKTGIDRELLAAASQEGGAELTEEQVEKINEAYNTVMDTANQLSDEQIKKINEASQEAVEASEELKMISELPSNNGVVERDPSEITETGEFKDLNVEIDPNSGERKILGDATDLVENETFDEMVERINAEGINFNTVEEPLTEDEIEKYLDPNNAVTGSIINEVVDKDYPLSKDAVKKIMEIANRRLKKEDFNVYKEFPDEVRDMVDKYLKNVVGVQVPMNSVQVKTLRNNVSESLIDDFISNISMDRVTTDFNKEVQDIFSKGAADVSESIVGYSRSKLESYRQSLDKIEDPEKKERLKNILERIDDAYNLTSLIEFASHCKIKKFDLEKPKRVFDTFYTKYKNSHYDVFSIDMAMPILYRRLNPNNKEEYTMKDVAAFFIAFVKQTMRFNSEEILDHTYMYYVTYNVVLTDINVADSTKEVSDTFLENVKKVIEGLRTRNPEALK